MTFSLNIKSAAEISDAKAARVRSKVNAERERRLVAGATFSVTGYGDIPVQGRHEDRINLLGLKDTARDLDDAGVTAAVVEFRDADNVEHMLTPQQMLELTNAARGAAQALYKASWDIKAMDPLPDDVTDDALWP